MSRSYKKHPCWTCGTSKSDKKAANKAVRRAAVVPNGSGYKKIYESYDICDGKFPQTKNSARLKYEANAGMCCYHMYDTLDEALADWARGYLRK